ncbi:MAG: hypothetical protein IPK63_01350 [Candidatus Competibacteraceae bacterium]|nr:hypothetical protein [Candidatus Competibacteraceae bacterium]
MEQTQAAESAGNPSATLLALKIWDAITEECTAEHFSWQKYTVVFYHCWEPTLYLAVFSESWSLTVRMNQNGRQFRCILIQALVIISHVSSPQPPPHALGTPPPLPSELLQDAFRG